MAKMGALRHIAPESTHFGDYYLLKILTSQCLNLNLKDTPIIQVPAEAPDGLHYQPGNLP
jgi:hypothetical protein